MAGFVCRPEWRDLSAFGFRRGLPSPSPSALAHPAPAPRGEDDGGPRNCYWDLSPLIESLVGTPLDRPGVTEPRPFYTAARNNVDV